MKHHLYLVLLLSLFSARSGKAQCLVPNNDFNDYWIVATLTNFADLFDPLYWTSNWSAAKNAINYYESGVYPASGAGEMNGAVVFDLIGALTETGIRTLDPVICTNNFGYPTSVKGHFQHLSDNTDTLSFILHLSSVDIWGDTSRETPTALLISSTLENTTFKKFEVPMPSPHENVYTQIDSISIVYKSQSDLAGAFILDEFTFGYSPSTDITEQWAKHVRILPTLVQRSVQIYLPSPLPGMRVQLVDEAGRVLVTRILEEEESLELDLDTLPPGMYFVKGTSPQGKPCFARKVVKNAKS